MVVHQFKPGQVANPLGAAAGKSKRELYRTARATALAVAPEMIDRQIELARSADERVAVIATNSLLDRAGLRAIDKPEFENDGRPKFDPLLLTPRQLAQVEAALRLMLKATRRPDGSPVAPLAPPPEIIQPETSDE